MSRIFYDTEFLERGPKHPIDLISIGMVRDDGAEYYAVSSEFDVAAVRAHPWLRENVWPYLPQLNNGDLDVRHVDVKPRYVISAEVASFVREKPGPELWAYYGAYDHVALCQLFGRMVDLPDGFPMFTGDLKREIVRLGVRRDELPEQEAKEHHALADARWNRDVSRFLETADTQADSRRLLVEAARRYMGIDAERFPRERLERLRAAFADQDDADVKLAIFDAVAPGIAP